MKDWEKMKRGERGITLIALIITIIVLVILAAVSIRAITNMQIVGHAINGTGDYARAGKEENKTLEETGNLIEDTLAKLNNIQNGGSSSTGGNEQTTEAPDLLKDYVLGAVDEETGLRPGKDLNTIFNSSTFAFIDDENTTADESTEVVTLNLYFAEVNDKIVYAKYNNVAYRILANLTNVDYSTYAYITSELVKVYEPEANSKVGQVVQYSVDGTQAGEREWLVLYDNGSTIDITPIDITWEDVEKENNPWTYTLGSGDENATGADDLAKAMDSYENAVTRLNTYCGTLITNPSVYTEGTGANAVRYVRSIGTQFDIADTTTRYSSTFLLNNPDTEEKGTYNGVGLTGDMNGEQDVVRMSYYSAGGTGSGYTTCGYEATEYDYWLACRYVEYYSDEYVYFMVNCGASGGCDLWGVYSSEARDNYGTCAVRPVVRVAVGNVSGL